MTAYSAAGQSMEPSKLVVSDAPLTSSTPAAARPRQLSVPVKHVAFALQIVPALLAYPESPRVNRVSKREDRAITALGRVRRLPVVSEVLPREFLQSKSKFSSKRATYPTISCREEQPTAFDCAVRSSFFKLAVIPSACTWHKIRGNSLIGVWKKSRTSCVSTVAEQLRDTPSGEPRWVSSTSHSVSGLGLH